MRMVSYLAGTVREIHPPSITLVVNGIGFAVYVPSRYQFEKDNPAELEIYTHVTQEQGMQLFGFKTSDERATFGLILTCSGIGPRIGLAILSSLTPALFASAVISGDIKALSSIEGIGPKKAESIIMQLRDKIAKLALREPGAEISSASRIKQVADVLSSLGYSRPEITAALGHLREAGLPPEASFDELLRKALALFAKKG
jgi:holliday junction DNA helicase RuvA